jgi:hypothetical protein
VLIFFIQGDLILRDLLLNKITHLYIDIKKQFQYFSSTGLKIFELILSLCKKLTVLNFGDIFLTRIYVVPLFELFFNNQMSSTIIKLKIKIEGFFDCSYLLDGRFNSLSTLIIYVSDANEEPNPEPTVSPILVNISRDPKD